jgi:hypothetical protein
MPSYLVAVDALGPELAEQVLNVIKTAQKITFAPTHRPMNRSEMMLPEKLVSRCREALDLKEHFKHRVVFFGLLRERRGDKYIAMALAEYGWTMSVIANVLGMHSVTLVRWGVLAHQRAHFAARGEGKILRPSLKDPDPRALSFGFERYQSLFPGEEATPRYYTALGTCLLMAGSEKVKSIAKQHQRADVRAQKAAKAARYK